MQLMVEGKRGRQRARQRKREERDGDDILTVQNYMTPLYSVYFCHEGINMEPLNQIRTYEISNDKDTLSYIGYQYL